MARQLTLKGDKPAAGGAPQGGGRFDFDPVPDNTALEAKVVAVSERDSRWDDDFNPGQKKRELNFRFEVEDPSYPEMNGRWFWGNTGTYFSTSAANKLRQWMTIIEDEDILPEGYVVDLDEIEARQPRVRIIVKAYQKKDGTFGNEVKELRPPRVMMQATPQAPAPAPAPVVEDPF